MSGISACTCNEGWEAVLNTQPLNRRTLTVTGSVTCPDQGLRVSLRRAVAQGFATDELLLDISVEEPAHVSHLVTTYALRYAEDNASFKTVRIVPCDLVIDVRTVS